MDEGRTFQVTDHLYAIWFTDGSIIWIEEIPSLLPKRTRGCGISKTNRVHKGRGRFRDSEAYARGTRGFDRTSKEYNLIESLADRALGD